MENKTVDSINNRNEAQNSDQFATLIDQTEEQIRGKLDVLEVPELSNSRQNDNGTNKTGADTLTNQPDSSGAQLDCLTEKHTVTQTMEMCDSNNENTDEESGHTSDDLVSAENNTADSPGPGKPQGIERCDDNISGPLDTAKLVGTENVGNETVGGSCKLKPLATEHVDIGNMIESSETAILIETESVDNNTAKVSNPAKLSDKGNFINAAGSSHNANPSELGNIDTNMAEACDIVKPGLTVNMDNNGTKAEDTTKQMESEKVDMNTEEMSLIAQTTGSENVENVVPVSSDNYGLSLSIMSVRGSVEEENESESQKTNDKIDQDCQNSEKLTSITTENESLMECDDIATQVTSQPKVKDGDKIVVDNVSQPLMILNVRSDSDTNVSNNVLEPNNDLNNISVPNNASNNISDPKAASDKEPEPNTSQGNESEPLMILDVRSESDKTTSNKNCEPTVASISVSEPSSVSNNQAEPLMILDIQSCNDKTASNKPGTLSNDQSGHLMIQDVRSDSDKISSNNESQPKIASNNISEPNVASSNESETDTASNSESEPLMILDVRSEIDKTDSNKKPEPNTASLHNATSSNVSEPLMILDVRSLSEPMETDADATRPDASTNKDGPTSDQSRPTMDLNRPTMDQNRPTLDQNRPMIDQSSKDISQTGPTKDETSKDISQSIAALKDMCSSVKMIASGSKTKQLTENMQTVSRSNVVQLTPSQESVNKVTSGSAVPSDPALPVTSCSVISSIKTEPPDDPRYGIAENHTENHSVTTQLMMNNYAKNKMKPLNVSATQSGNISGMQSGNISGTHSGNVSVTQSGQNNAELHTYTQVGNKKVPVKVVTTSGYSSVVTAIKKSHAGKSNSKNKLVLQFVKPTKSILPKTSTSQNKSISQNTSASPNTIQTSGTPLQKGSVTNQVPGAVVVIPPGKIKTAVVKSAVFDDVPLEPMNIRNIGASKITELIARKNPIAPYKPKPVPEILQGMMAAHKQYPCYECGDTFMFEKSLHNHLSRRSMQIRFKCETCLKHIYFTNKCQMLNHLRSHLNIDNTQAVPIHIKSDSIEISTFYNELASSTEFKFFQDLPVYLTKEKKLFDNISDQCIFCGLQYKSDSHRIIHFQQQSGSNRNHYCNTNKCPVYMKNSCGIQAHRQIHKTDVIMDTNRKLTALICPECGEVFSNERKAIEYLFHLKHHCHHLSRYCEFSCKKCEFFCNSESAMENHLLLKSDMYYKCQRCPVALQSMKSFLIHLDDVHSYEKNVQAKTIMLYRCHYCGTLISDPDFLMSHIQNHVTEIKKNALTKYRCVLCGQKFADRDLLVSHCKQTHKSLAQKFSFCTFCCHMLDDPYTYALHMLQHAAEGTQVTTRFCKACGMVCIDDEDYRLHKCIDKVREIGASMNLHKFSDYVKLIPFATKSYRVAAPSKAKFTMTAAKPLVSKNPSIKQTKGPHANQRDELVKAKSITSPSNVNNKTSADESLPPSLKLPEGVSPTCPVCGETFKGKVHRINHLRRHRDANVFVCIACDDTSFTDYHALRSHEIACASIKNQIKKSAELKPKIQTARKGTTPKLKITRNHEQEFSVQLVPDKRAFTPLRKDVEEKCDQCGAVFTRKSKLEEHKKQEHGLHPCHLCGLMHESQSALKKHLILSHEGRKLRYVCFICKSRKIDRNFTEKAKLEKHMRQKHRMKQWDDSLVEPQVPGFEGKCLSPEPEKRKLETQSDSNSEETPTKKAKTDNEHAYKCAKCLFTSDVRDKFIEHIKEHIVAETVQCLECGLSFAVLPSLRKHLFMVHKVKNFDKYCQDNKIEEPKEMTSEAIPEINPDVSEEDSSESELEIDESNSLECRVCHKKFETEAAVNGHMRTHGMALIKKLRKKGSSCKQDMGKDPTPMDTSETADSGELKESENV